MDLVSELRRSPLHGRHVGAGAKFAAFGGWEMPVEFAGGGVLAEHAAVRETVGLFDVSHLGTALVRGPGAGAHVDSVLTNDLARIGPGRSQYTLCCTEDGGIVDDLLVYLLAEDDLLLVPNAANAAAVLSRLRAAAPAGVEVVDRHAEVAVLAVQGPRADEVLAAVGLPAGHPYGSFLTGRVPRGSADQPDPGVPVRIVLADGVTVCRTGYTGERGYELLLAADAAPALWDALLAAVTAAGGRPAGLGARDTLRTEMGFPLHGQDIGPTTNPVEARLGWAVGWTKSAFTGRDRLTAVRAAGPARRLWGLRATGRGIPRPGMTVADASGAAVGTVTSGTFSPTLRRGIGLALVDAAVVVGDAVTVGIRGRDEPFEVLKPPFVANHTTG